MKQAILFFTDQGMETALNIARSWPGETPPKLWVHHKAEALLAQALLAEGTMSERDPGDKGRPFDYEGFNALKEILPRLWRESSVLIFIMASGIVVRHIAPFLQSKDRDPAVLVLDEKGQYVIPLLSGHLGGANAWAKALAQGLGGQAVLTTATDVRGLTAPDEYARRFNWAVEPLAALHSVNRFLLDQGFLLLWDNVGLPEDHPLRQDPHYRFVDEGQRGEAHVWLGFADPGELREPQSLRPVQLIPRIYSVGIGCRRGVATEQVLAAVRQGMASLDLPLKSIKGFYSIDLKADETGIIATAAQLGVPFATFPAEQVQALNENKGLIPSDFVKNKIGVDGVCEAASLLGTKQGELVLPKQKLNGVTVALSREKSMWWGSAPEIPSI